jgi:sugar/nucleoside kinase (ribokinase family)
MSLSIISLGELLVEVMRKEVDQPLSQPADFAGPFPSGAPAIFLDAAARLGAGFGIATRFIGVVGASNSGGADTGGCADDFGRCVIDRLAADGVDTGSIRRAPGWTTGIAFVAYRSDGSRKFVFHLAQSAAALLGPEDVHPEYFAGIGFLHLTGSALSFSETARQAAYRAVELCKQAGGRVSFDPNLRPELLGPERVRELCEPVLRACDLLLPSGAEAGFLAGETDELHACRSLVRRGIPIVALKQGERGSTVFTRSETIQAPPYPVNEVDPTGAGDCYGGAFAAGLLHGWDLPRVARFANVAGALSVTRLGPMEGIPRVEDVLGKM